MKLLVSVYVCFTTLIFTSLMWALVLHVQAGDRQRAFIRESDAIHERLETQFAQVMKLLEALQRLFAGYVQVVPDVLELYIAIPWQNTPGVRSVGFAPRLTFEELPDYVRYARQTLDPRYHVRPAGRRALYFPVEHVVPSQDGPLSPGTDLAVDKQLLKAIQQVEESGTSAIVPWKGSLEHDSLLLFGLIAVHNLASGGDSQGETGITGLCFLLVDPVAVIEAALLFSYDTSRITFVIRSDEQGDIVGGADESVMHATGGAPSVATEHHRRLRIADSHWVVEFRSGVAFDDGWAGKLTALIFAGGVLFSSIIAMIAYILYDRRFFFAGRSRK
jgi:hypothetical protein